MNEVERYIRERAAYYGIDPDTAVRVAKAEGGLSNPQQQSNIRKGGKREPSYGPFQLLVGGPGTGFPSGLGNEFINRYGVHPKDDWRTGVDFALSTVAKDGWRQFYGARNTGINRWDGIRGTTLNSAPVAAGTPAPPITTSRDIADRPIAAAPSSLPPLPTEPQPMSMESIANALTDPNSKPGQGFSTMLKAMGGGGGGEQQQGAQIDPATALASSMASDQGRMQAASQMMANLLLQRQQRRGVPGLSLMG